MSEKPSTARDRIIVALDLPTEAEAYEIACKLRGLVGGFKVGLELLTSAGPDVVGRIHGLRSRVMYDAKFHDIPNTMAGAVRAATELGVWGFTVHASAGRKALEAAVANKGQSLVLAVTVLTSLDEIGCDEVYRMPPILKAVEFATFAAQAGVTGVVCSPQEVRAIRNDENTANLIRVVPGVRPAWAARDDQARVMTPGEAIRAGADYLVIGRPILRPPPGIGGRAEAVRLIVEEIEEAMR